MSNTHTGRLDADPLSSLKSTFTFTRRSRPPPPAGPSDHLERMPLDRGANKIARRESKGGLRGIFTRTKADPDLGYAFYPVTEESVQEEILIGRRPLQVTGKADSALDASTHRQHAKSISSTSETKSAERVLRMGIRAKPTKTKPASKSNIKPTSKACPKPPRRTLAAWDPPPLFQAYPQAIKHAQLSSSTLSADSILRISNHKKSSSLREDIIQTSLGGDEVQTPAAKRTEKARSKHRRQISGSLSKSEWTQKIYVLVTSGYLLQYSGDGSFDRLPEKMMQLGKDSVAFASDVIPGKHWVLQISQAMDADGTPAPDARSLLSRLTFRGADYRRNATSLLLILDSAEELESWIATVRREIEALGGKKYISETGKPKVDGEIMQLKAQPSQRHLVQRDPVRFSNTPTPWRHSIDHDRRESAPSSLGGRSMISHSAERPSLATSFTPHEGQPLDSLRDNSLRLSYMSSGQRTLVTSQASSPTCSPTQEAFVIEESQPSNSIEEVRPRPNATAISERRRSMQTVQNPAFQFPTTLKAQHSRPHSTYGSPGRAAPPNFSIPHATSKRYTLARIPDNVSRPLSTQSKTPGKVQEMSMKGNRKSPPASLTAGPLSPVTDQNSPVIQQSVYALMESPSKKVVKRRASITESLPRSHSGPTRKSFAAAIESFHATRWSILSSSRSPGTASTTLQFTSNDSTMQTHPIMTADAPKSPTRIAKQLPVSPEMVPLPPSPHVSLLQLEAPRVDKVAFPSISGDPPTPRANMSKPRRPASMQVLTNKVSTLTVKTMPPPNGTSTPITLSVSKSINSSTASPSLILTHPVSIPAPPSSDMSPPVQHLKSESGGIAKKDLTKRRSAPHLVNGPPPAPPPSCALPPLPGGMKSPLGLKSVVSG